jgi:ketosteroid isomerase-like protein
MSTIAGLSHEERIRQMFAGIDSLDPAASQDHVTDDIQFRFANAEPVTGKAALEQGGVGFFATLASIRHEITTLWEPEPDVVVTEMEVTYGRHDGSVLTLPCVNVFRFRGDLIATYSIYMDITPVYT